MDEARDMAEMGIILAGAYRNMDYVKPHLTVLPTAQQVFLDPAADPQTRAAFSSRSRARTQSRFFASPDPPPERHRRRSERTSRHRAGIRLIQTERKAKKELNALAFSSFYIRTSFRVRRRKTFSIRIY